MFLKFPSGFVKYYGDIKSFPKECFVCGKDAYKEYKISKFFDLRGGSWFPGFTYRWKNIFVHVCKKHYINLILFRVLFWILLIGLVAGSEFGDPVHYLIILSFPIVAYIYFSMKNKIAIYNVKRQINIDEVILVISDNSYLKKLRDLEGVEQIRQPDSPMLFLVCN